MIIKPAMACGLILTGFLFVAPVHAVTIIQSDGSGSYTPAMPAYEWSPPVTPRLQSQPQPQPVYQAPPAYQAVPTYQAAPTYQDPYSNMPVGPTLRFHCSRC